MKGALTVSALVGFAVLAVTSAHMCLLSPRQRGSMMHINTHATTDCILLASPCGGRPMGSAQVDLRAGQNFTVVFQKNADHWAEHTPGDFTIRFGIATAGHMAFDDLVTIPDMGEPSLSIYTKDVHIPDNARGHYVLSVDYRTNNAHAPAHFYQCSDVFVV